MTGFSGCSIRISPAVKMNEHLLLRIQCQRLEEERCSTLPRVYSCQLSHVAAAVSSTWDPKKGNVSATTVSLESCRLNNVERFFGFLTDIWLKTNLAPGTRRRRGSATLGRKPLENWETSSFLVITWNGCVLPWCAWAEPTPVCWTSSWLGFHFWRELCQKQLCNNQPLPRAKAPRHKASLLPPTPPSRAKPPPPQLAEVHQHDLFCFHKTQAASYFQ